MIGDCIPYVAAFLSSLVLTLLLTPAVRAGARALGMVDKPDPRRINKVPIPRGGGLAIVIGVILPYAILHFVTGRPCIQGLDDAAAYKLAAIAVFVSLVGLADDKFSLKPRVKLALQLVGAVLVWAWAGLGFRTLWPFLPAWVDFLITVFWITGAINAFNFIDGLDGLAAGLSFIAVLGMAGSLFVAANPQAPLFYFAMMGGILGFLRYNFHPASVFLGDCGSMFLGFVVSVLPLASQTPNSFLVSVGVPLLAMGVPIFDTTLAILRRSVRKLIGGGKARETGGVMQPDSDHLHHRILRSSGLNQRKAAWVLYALAAGCVMVGLCGMLLQSRAAGFWLASLALATYVIFKDSRIELFDAGRYLNELAHTKDSSSRRRVSVLAAPLYVVFDILAMSGIYFFCAWALNLNIDLHDLRTELPIRVSSTFAFLVVLRTYRTVWSRALLSNYVRMLIACAAGAIAGSVFIYYWPSLSPARLKAFTILYWALTFVALSSVRMVRGVVRDIFYALDCARIVGRKDVSRILVYGAGLRYRSFRRELVRKASGNNRIIVGMLDDDVCLRGRYIGGIKVLGTINQAPEIITEVNADAVVMACETSEAWMRIVRKVLEPTGVKVSVFSFTEKPLCEFAAECGENKGKVKQ